MLKQKSSNTFSLNMMCHVVWFDAALRREHEGEKEKWKDGTVLFGSNEDEQDQE